MMRLHTLYLSVPRLHALVDQDGRLVHLYRVPGYRIESGAIVCREMVEGMFKPGFDGDRLALDAFGMMRVMDYIDRTSRAGTSEASQAKRLRALVRSLGFRREMIRAMRAFASDTLGQVAGEAAVFERQVIDQMHNAWLRYRSLVPLREVDAGYERARRITCGVADEVLR